MSRRRQPLHPIREGWTIQRATGLGAPAALAAVVVRLLHAGEPRLFRLPLLALCLFSAFCGLSILWITAVDRLRRGRRGDRLVPLRAFDLAMAALLLLPALLLAPDLVREIL